MFFLGLLVGAGVYFVAFLIWNCSGKMGWAVAVTIAIFIALFSVAPRLCGGAVAAFIVIVIIGSIVAKRVVGKQDEEEERRLVEEEKKSYYKNHCWNCGHPIDGLWNERCPDCNEYYICPKCGACKCDFGKSPPFKHPKNK